MSTNLTFRKVIKIGIAPGNLAGDPSRGYLATVTRPKYKLDEQGVLIPDPSQGVEVVLDVAGKALTYMRYGARPPGQYGPNDPGDPGIPTLRFRVAFWLRAPPGKAKPIPQLDRAGNQSHAWLVPTQVSTEGAQGVKPFELEALRAGVLIERVVDEAGGQFEVTKQVSELDERLLKMWGDMQAELVTPPISGVQQFSVEEAGAFLQKFGG